MENGKIREREVHQRATSIKILYPFCSSNFALKPYANKQDRYIESLYQKFTLIFSRPRVMRKLEVKYLNWGKPCSNQRKVHNM